MDASCLQYCLTEEERRTFNETGLLMVENALSPEQIAALAEATDRIYERKLTEGHDPRKALLFPNFIPEDDLFTSTDADVPLRVWLREHRPQDAA